MNQIVFFFSNKNNLKMNGFVNSLIERTDLENVIKINCDKRKVNINNTPALKIKNKILYNNDCLTFLSKLEKQKNKKIIDDNKTLYNLKSNNNDKEPNTYDTIEMNNFSDSYSFLEDERPLESKYEYVNKQYTKIKMPNNLTTIDSKNISINDEKQKFNSKSYNDYLQNRNNDPFIKK